MARCDNCQQEMTTHVGCTLAAHDGQPPRLPWDGEDDCHDCFAPPGTLHHPGCDMERCPMCGGQAIACECCDQEEADNG